MRCMLLVPTKLQHIHTEQPGAHNAGASSSQLHHNSARANAIDAHLRH